MSLLVLANDFSATRFSAILDSRALLNVFSLLPYLLIGQVSTFADTRRTCVILVRADGVEWLGADTFAVEDLERQGLIPIEGKEIVVEPDFEKVFE